VGDPRGYDITVIRKGQSLDTEYTVQPTPPKEFHPDVQAAFEEKKLELEAVFEGGDPFGGEVTVGERKDDGVRRQIEPPEVVKRHTRRLRRSTRTRRPSNLAFRQTALEHKRAAEPIYKFKVGSLRACYLLLSSS
jgi:hypothetical protein